MILSDTIHRKTGSWRNNEAAECRTETRHQTDGKENFRDKLMKGGVKVKGTHVGFKGKWKPNMKLPVCSVAMTVDYNKNTELHDIMLRNGRK